MDLFELDGRKTLTRLLLQYFTGTDTSRNIFFSKHGSKYEGKSLNDLIQHIFDLSENFRGWGLQKGDKVAIISENRFEWVAVDFACMFAGLVSVPIYVSIDSSQVEYILDNSSAKVCFVSNNALRKRLIPVVSHLKELSRVVLFDGRASDSSGSEVLNYGDLVRSATSEQSDQIVSILSAMDDDINEEDLLTIIYTSGTTGVPKGVMLTHKNIYSNIRACRKVLPIDGSDTFLSFLPYSHSYERTAGYYLALFSCSRIFYAQNIETLSQQMPEVQPTIMMTVPRLLDRIYNRLSKSADEMEPGFKKKIFVNAMKMADEKSVSKNSLKWKIADKLVYSKIRAKTGGRLRFFVSGGGALNKKIAEFFEYIGVVTLEGYGLTETSPVISVNPLAKNKYGTVGLPLDGVNVMLSGDNEILVKGDLVMKGYYEDKKSTDEMIRDGWLYTGDIGDIDQDGYLRITDRKKSLFKTSGGKYVAPAPLEDKIMTLPYIESVMVCGNGRMYVTALIVPQRNDLLIFAAKNGVAFQQYEELFENERLMKFIQSDIDKALSGISGFEKVRRFTLLKEPFSIDTGELTPTMKVKRSFVEHKYAQEIEKMYLKV